MRNSLFFIQTSGNFQTSENFQTLKKFLAIPSLCESFWKKMLGKIQNGHSKFGKNCLKKFGMAIFGYSEFVQVNLGKIVK